MIQIQYPGYAMDKNIFDNMNDEQKKEYCTDCWDSTSFPGFLCEKCPLFKKPDNFKATDDKIHTDEV